MANYVSKGYTTPTGVDSREDVMRIQRELGVKVDGIWGRNTQAAYDSAYASWSTGSGSKKSKTNAAGSAAKLPSTGSQIIPGMGRSTTWTGFGTGSQIIPGMGRSTTARSGNAPASPVPSVTGAVKGAIAGSGGQMHAEEIAATEKQRRREAYMANPNPYENKNYNYGSLGGWQVSMPISEKPDPVEYTGGLGGIQHHIQQAQKAGPDVEVLVDQSQLTEEKMAELEQEKKEPQFKLAETAHRTTDTNNYRKKEYEAMVFWSQLPAEARQPGQGSDYFQPAVAYLEAENAELEQELQYWINLKARGNPVLTKDADSMIASLRRDIEKNEKTLSKLIYILPEDIFRNEFGAEYAELLCLRTLDKEQKKQVNAAVESLRATRLACYIEGDYGRAAAAEDILNVLERKQAGMAAFTGAANNLALGLPDYLVSQQYAKQETDYDRFLNYMYSADAIQAANPNAYAAGDAAATAFSLAMASTGIYKAGVRQFGDDAINMIGGKGQLQRVGEETTKKYAEWVRDKLIELGIVYSTDQNYHDNESR